MDFLLNDSKKGQISLGVTIMILILVAVVVGGLIAAAGFTGLNNTVAGYVVTFILIAVIAIIGGVAIGKRQ